jgi:hypothetical protein
LATKKKLINYSKARAMNLSNHFELSRLKLLLKMELCRSRKGVLITVVVVFGLLFTGFILENIFSNSKVFISHGGNFTFFLLAGGFILSSLAFGDLGNPVRRSNYLLLPASTFEKFLSMWLLTCIGWIIAFTITYFIYTLIANYIGHLLFKNITFMAFEPFVASSLLAIRLYIVLQAIFLVGAVHFRGYAFPKTIFTLMLFGIVCGILFYVIMAKIIHSDFECTGEYNPFKEGILNQILMFAQWLLWWILAPLSWVITYLGLKEQEV